MELVNPPDGFASVFPDGQIVETDVGFGTLKSTHCAFVQAVRDYQARVFTSVADLMVSAGQVPALQTGEYLWWFFNNPSGMGFYHPEIRAAAQAALGRPAARVQKANRQSLGRWISGCDVPAGETA